MATNLDNGSGRRGNPWRKAVWGTASSLLLLPAVAMQFTREVSWDAADFIVIGAMLLAACGAYELATRMSGSTAYRAGSGIAIVAAFLLVWINLAVGVIDTEDDPVNLVFGAVLAVGVAGSFIAGFRPMGMARAMVATAIAQGVAGVFALVVGQGGEGAVLSAFFVVVWLASALLFRRATRESGAASAAS